MEKKKDNVNKLMEERCAEFKTVLTCEFFVTADYRIKKKEDCSYRFWFVGVDFFVHDRRGNRLIPYNSIDNARKGLTEEIAYMVREELNVFYIEKLHQALNAIETYKLDVISVTLQNLKKQISAYYGRVFQHKVENFLKTLCDFQGEIKNIPDAKEIVHEIDRFSTAICNLLPKT
jgi:hypothetical protein